MTVALPATTTPEALAEHMGWSPRRVRKLARDLGACRIMGNRMMTLTDEDVKVILASQGAEASLLTLPAIPAPAPTPQATPTIHGPKQGYIYFVECKGFVKIGYSTDPRVEYQTCKSPALIRSPP